MTSPATEQRWIVVPAGARKSLCRASTCKAMIWWVKTAKGKDMPVDCGVDGGIEPGALTDGRGVSHWGTCADTERFRKPREV